VRRPIRTEALLARLPLFQGLRDAELARLAAATTRRELARGAVLFREGEPSTGLHVVVYGRIKLTMRDAGGRQRLFDLVGPGRSFGEPIMFLDKPYIVTAAAAADSLVLHVDKQAIFEALERNPAFARRIIGALAERVESVVREARSHALGPGKKRFVAWLLEREPAAAGEIAVTLPAAKKEVASRLQLSAEHFSRILRELSDQALIEVRGRRVRVPDVALLREHARV
jgi:CRP-like cAMP-binding protein